MLSDNPLEVIEPEAFKLSNSLQMCVTFFEYIDGLLDL